MLNCIKRYLFVLFALVWIVSAERGGNFTYYPKEMQSLSYNASEFIIGEQSCVTLKIGYGIFE